jgi:hypothetical protein
MNVGGSDEDKQRTVSHTRIRLHPHWRCVCGHILGGQDVHVLDDTHIALDCPRCHKRLLDIEVETHAVN